MMLRLSVALVLAASSVGNCRFTQKIQFSNVCPHNMENHKQLKFPYEITPIENHLNTELLTYFHGERTGFVRVGPEQYFFPSKFQLEATAFYNFQARPDDIWVATFPRSGTTWAQELVWLVANNLNFTEANSKLLTERFPFFEFSLFVHREVKSELLKENATDLKKCAFIEQFSTPGYELLSQLPCTQRRFIKTHFPFSLLPPSVMKKQCKLIYIARNPLDVAVSYYHLNRLYRTQGYVGDFKRYWYYFENGLNPWLPYYSHLKEALAQRTRPNVLFLNYEDMCQDLRETINKVATFLNCSLTDKGVDQLISHLNIKNFRNNQAVNGHEMAEVGVLNKGEESFVRTGGTSSLQKEYAEDTILLNRAQTWVRNNEATLLGLQEQ